MRGLSAALKKGAECGESKGPKYGRRVGGGARGRSQVAWESVGVTRAKLVFFSLGKKTWSTENNSGPRTTLGHARCHVCVFIASSQIGHAPATAAAAMVQFKTFEVERW